MRTTYLEDYAVGRTVTLDPVGVTEQEIIEFGTSYDPQPFHVDPVAAADSPFGSVIASGWHTCALTMRALVAGFFSPLSSLGSPGIDELRWAVPVRGGDVLTATAIVLENRRSASKPDRGVIRTAITTRNQDDVTVLSLTAINLVRARP